MVQLRRPLLQQDEGSASVTNSSSSPLQCFSMIALSPGAGGGIVPAPFSPPPWMRELRSDERGLCLIHLLLNCAGHVASGALEQADACLEHISLLAAPDGDAMQRIASCFTEALARRALRCWPGLYRALSPVPRSTAAESSASAARRSFLDLCPFLKLAYVVSNQAIVEAMEGERVVHVVDLNASDPIQWIALLQALAARPGGPPHLRITGVDEHKELLDLTAARLSEEAEKLDIPFQFNSVVSRPENLDINSLRIKTGEALAVNSVLQLHNFLAADDAGHRKSTTPPCNKGTQFHSQRLLSGSLGELLDKDITTGASHSSPDSTSSSPIGLTHSPKMDSFLSALWRLSPKIVVVTEQESNHNAPTLRERFTEALNFYAALFDCLESTAPRASAERARVERELLGEEIKNIIACEGLERRERHEKLERWIHRMDAAGFGRAPLSYYALLQARRLLQGYGCQGYNVRQDKGCLHICWQERALYSVSAWCTRYD